MYVLLVRSAEAQSDTHRTVTWKDCFAALDWEGEGHFIKAWIEQM
jgi:hypothetical protein